MEITPQELLLISLSGIVVLGIFSEWLAWRVGVPSIMPLLLCGILFGPILGLIQPDALLGNDIIRAIVSFSAAIILYDGGLSLRFRELTLHGPVVRKLLSVGIVANWIIVTLAGVYILGLNTPIAILLGAIMIITGPTAMGPILRHAHLKTELNSILKWEGMLNGPIGGMLVVIAFEAVVAGELGQQADLGGFPLAFVLGGVARFIFLGTLIGALGGGFLILLFQRRWVPDFMHNVVSLATLLAVFIGANLLQKDAGLLAATVMGIAIANQNRVPISHVIAFKENLRLLLIATLFILLSARLDIADLQILDLRAVLFIGVIMLVARPVSVLLSSFGSALSFKERLFIGYLNPKGIVAASITAIVALELLALDPPYPQAEVLMPMTFLVILATIILYSLSVTPLARLMGLSQKNPQGVLIVGAHYWARQLGAVLRETGHHVVMIDTNRSNVYAARAMGLDVRVTSALSETLMEDIELGDVGYVLAITSNDEVNALAAVHFSDLVNPKHIYQLQPAKRSSTGSKPELASRLRGRILFNPPITYRELTQKFSDGAMPRVYELTGEATLDSITAPHAVFLPLFLLDQNNNLQVFTADRMPETQPGMRVVALVQDKSPE